MNNKPIGVFDSGLGGLTVVSELSKMLPNESIVYLGDTARVPYGTRSEEIIKKFSIEDADLLIKKNVKCIIIACNTSSAIAGTLLKQKIKIPVFDVIGPALTEAKKISGKAKVGTIGTRATIASGAYKGTIGVECPLLVPFIEEGEINSEALKLVISSYLKKLKPKKIKALILGCTHYPIIQKLIQKEIGSSVKLVNPEKTVVEEVKKYLTDHKMLSSTKRTPKKKFFVTDLTGRFTKVAEMFLGERIRGRISKVNL